MVYAKTCPDTARTGDVTQVSVMDRTHRMQIILHCGVYSSDTGLLFEALQKNLGNAVPLRTQVIDPEVTRVVLRKLMRAGRDGHLPDNARDILFEVADVRDDTERLILASPAALGTYRDLVAPQVFFPNAVDYLQVVRQIFANDDMAISYAMRNPATLLSSVVRDAKAPNLEQITGPADPMQLRWSELAARLRQAMPDVHMTIWYNEDIPLIWSEILRIMLDLPDDTPLTMAHAPMFKLLQPDDIQKFEDYIAKHPGMIPAQERRVITTFVEKMARPEMIEEEIGIDGWTQDYVDDLTRHYEADQPMVQAVADVRLILP